jgi:hypothetical protein
LKAFRGKADADNAQPVRIEKIDRDEILGLSQYPWARYYFAAAMIGAVLFIFLGPAVAMLKYEFLMLPVLLHLVRIYLRSQAKKSVLGQELRFFADLRMRLSLRRSVLLALEDLSTSPPEETPIYQQLGIVFAGSRPSSSVDALETLATRLQSARVQALASAVKASIEGTLNVDDYLTSAIRDMAEEIRGKTEEDLQGMPLRITLLAMPFLLGPIVVMLLYPIADRVLKTLAGFG